MLEEIGTRRTGAIECLYADADQPRAMREPVLFAVFAMVAVALTVIGSPIMLSVACVFGVAAYSSLMGIARQVARSSSPPIWAKVVNYIRECLANEPEMSGNV